MGNPKSGQTTHRLPVSRDGDAEGTGTAGQVEFSRPPASVKPEFKPGLIASLCTKAAIPAISSLQSEEAATPFALDDNSDIFYDTLGSQDYQQQGLGSRSSDEVQQASAHSPFGTTIVGDDAFYDAPSTLECESVSIPTPHYPHHPEHEGASKCITGSPAGRGHNSGVCASEPPNTATPNAPILPPTSTQGRGASSSVAASSPIGSAPISEPHVSRRKGLLVGINCLQSAQPLKYAAKDAIDIGLALSDVLGFSGEDLVFAIDGKRPESAKPSTMGVGLGSRRSRGTASGRNQSSSGGAQWERQVYFDNKKRFVYPTRRNIIEGFRWLVKDAKEGDHLVWLYSGHCSYIPGKGPYLVTPDIGKSEATNPGGINLDDAVSKDDIRDELVLKVPKGCQLDIFLDCCHSSALLDLEYCIGHMCQEESLLGATVSIGTSQTLQRHATSMLSQIPAPTATEPDVEHTLKSQFGRGNFHASLFGLEQVPYIGELPEIDPGAPDLMPISAVEAREPVSTSVAYDAPPPAQPIAVATSHSPRKVSKRTNGIAAASPPPPMPPSSQASGWFSNWGAAMTTPALEHRNEEPEVKPSIGTQVKHVKHGVIEAPRPPSYLFKREGNFRRPEGYVTMWAAAGRFESAFEASKPAEHGILANVLCQALGARKEITARDLWVFVGNAVQLENKMRSERDQEKPEKDREDPRKRTQHAELWVSHPELFFTTSSILDRQAFPVPSSPQLNRPPRQQCRGTRMTISQITT